MAEEEFPHDPRDDFYPVTPFDRDVTAPSLEDLNATPHPEVPAEPREPEPEPEVEPSAVATESPPVIQPDPPPAAVVALAPPPRKTRPTGITPSERHIDALLILASFYEEHPDAYVPGGERFSTAQAFLERMMNLGGEWEFEHSKDGFVVRLAGMPDGLGPHLHVAADTLASQWLDDVGVHSAP